MKFAKALLALSMLFILAACNGNRSLSGNRTNFGGGLGGGSGSGSGDNGGNGGGGSSSHPIICHLSAPSQHFELIEYQGQFYDAQGNEIDGTDPFTLTVTATRNGVPVNFTYNDPPNLENGLIVHQAPSNVPNQSKTFELRLMDTGIKRITLEVIDPTNSSNRDSCFAEFRLDGVPPEDFTANLRVNGSTSTEVAHGMPVQLSWSVPEATYCSVFRIPPSGNETELPHHDVVENVTSGNHSHLGQNPIKIFNYRLECEGFGQSDSNTVEVRVRRKPRPVVRGRVLPGGSWQDDLMTVAWHANYRIQWWNSVTSHLACRVYVNGFLQNFGGLNNFRDVLEATQNAHWEVFCYDVENEAEGTSAEIQVNVQNAPAPSCTITVTETDTEPGGSTIATVHPDGDFHTVRINNQVIQAPYQKTYSQGMNTPLGEVTLNGKVTGPGGNGTCQVVFERHEYAFAWDFGGMFSLGNPQYNNPATGGQSCPQGYIKKKIYGTPNMDHSMWFCYRPHQVGRNPRFDWGGAWANYWTGSGVGYRNNPATGSTNVPNGYTQQALLGTNNIDWGMWYGYKNHQDGTAPQHGMGGFYSPPNNQPGNAYKNPITNTYGCPSGYQAHKLLHAYFNPGDRPIYGCYKSAP